MTSLLWAAFGMTIGAAILHAALGLARPLDRTYLSFACIMALLAAYVFFEVELYRSTTPEQASEALRRQLIAAHGFLAFVLLFVPAYSKVRIPRAVLAAFWAGLAVLFVANLVLPYGIWFSAPPELVHTTFRGEPYTAAIAPPMELPQYVHTVYVLSLFVLAFSCAIVLFRRGKRQRGAILAIALAVVVLHHIVDLVRDAVGGAWPYLAEFGLVAWGHIMSVQLALDFRASEQRLQETLSRAEQHAAELARMVQATLDVRDKLNTPLQTLELGLAVRTPHGPEDAQTLADLQRAVVDLTQLGRAVEQTTSLHRHPTGRPEPAP